MRSNIETLRLEAESKQDEIDRLKDKLDQLINQSEEAESEEMITHLKNQIKELVQQLALERQEAETKHNQQSETIESLQEELKKQYRSKSRWAHPDKHGGSNLLFQEVAKAYETLQDPKKRRDYDEGFDLNDIRCLLYTSPSPRD